MNTNIKKYAWLSFLWLTTALAGLSLADAGLGKFQHAEGWEYWFGQWGYPADFSLVTGGLEILIGLAVLIPRLASYSAIMAITIMLSAFITLLTNESDLSLIDPWFNIILMQAPLWGRWKSRWRFRQKT